MSILLFNVYSHKTMKLRSVEHKFVFFLRFTVFKDMSIKIIYCLLLNKISNFDIRLMSAGSTRHLKLFIFYYLHTSPKSKVRTMFLQIR